MTVIFFLLPDSNSKKKSEKAPEFWTVLQGEYPISFPRTSPIDLRIYMSAAQLLARQHMLEKRRESADCRIRVAGLFL